MTKVFLKLKIKKSQQMINQTKKKIKMIAIKHHKFKKLFNNHKDKVLILLKNKVKKQKMKWILQKI